MICNATKSQLLHLWVLLLLYLSNSYNINAPAANPTVTRTSAPPTSGNVQFSSNTYAAQPATSAVDFGNRPAGGVNFTSGGASTGVVNTGAVNTGAAYNTTNYTTTSAPRVNFGAASSQGYNTTNYVAPVTTTTNYVAPVTTTTTNVVPARVENTTYVEQRPVATGYY